MSEPFFIDKITNSVEDSRTGAVFPTEVIAVDGSQIKRILKKDRMELQLEERT